MSFQNLTIEELTQSKVYVNPKRSIFSYQHPMDYSNIFLNEMSKVGANINIRAEVDASNANEDNTLNISYGTVLFRAKLPQSFDLYVEDTMFNHMTGEIGYVLNLNSATPELRCYRGKRVEICDNGCIFGADDITTHRLASTSKSEVNDAIKRYVDTFIEMNETHVKQIHKMMEHKYREDDFSLDMKIGQIVRTSIKNTKIGINIATGLIKNIEDSKSLYRIVNGVIDGWTLYNAATEECKKVSIKDESTKLLMLESFNL